MTVLNLPVNVGAQAYGISEGLRHHGIESEVLTVERSSFGFKSDRVIDVKSGFRPLKLLQLGFFFIQSIFKYDTFIFYYGSTFFSYPNRGPLPYDLILLKLLGKKTAVFFQGCDVRLSSVCPGHDIDTQEKALHNPASDRRVRDRVKIFSRWADKLYALNPDLMDVVKRAEFFPYANLNLSEWQPRQFRPSQKLIILHAPSDRKVKGTDQIVDVIRKLKSRYSQIELDLVEKVSRDDLKKRIQRSSIVIDQVKIGWYGGFAVEAMALGKPVVAYINDRYAKMAGLDGKIPIVSATEKTLPQMLEQLIRDQKKRTALGQAGRKFVEEVHNVDRLADRLIKDLEIK